MTDVSSGPSFVIQAKFPADIFHADGATGITVFQAEFDFPAHHHFIDGVVPGAVFGQLVDKLMGGLFDVAGSHDVVSVASVVALEHSKRPLS